MWIVNGKQYLKINDLQFHNAVWLMFVTSSTVGYGDFVPETHAGRLVAAAAALSGIILASLLTAALCNFLRWTPEESHAVSVVRGLMGVGMGVRVCINMQENSVVWVGVRTYYLFDH
jgi:hypothetical protein